MMEDLLLPWYWLPIAGLIGLAFGFFLGGRSSDNYWAMHGDSQYGGSHRMSQWQILRRVARRRIVETEVR